MANSSILMLNTDWECNLGIPRSSEARGTNLPFDRCSSGMRRRIHCERHFLVRTVQPCQNSVLTLELAGCLLGKVPSNDWPFHSAIFSIIYGGSTKVIFFVPQLREDLVEIFSTFPQHAWHADHRVYLSIAGHRVLHYSTSGSSCPR
jgi:hypothetical protein